MSGGGGGGGQAYYVNQERLLEEQTAMARALRGVAEGSVIPAYKGLLQNANEFASIENRTQAAQRAGAAAAAAGEGNIQSMRQNAESLGINPNDERMFRQERVSRLGNAANTSSAYTGAYDAKEREGFARKMDVIGLGMGVPGQATAAMSSAAQTNQQGMNSSLMQQRMDQQAWADTISGGMNAWQLWKAADGGFVTKKGIVRGGSKPTKQGARKFARGGFVGAGGNRGFLTPPQVQPMPTGPSGPPRPSPGAGIGAGVAGYRMGQAGSEMVGAGIRNIGQMAGNTGMQQVGYGMELGKGAKPTIDVLNAAQQAATQAVDSALPAVIPEASGVANAAVASEAAATGAMAGEAATAGAAAGEAAGLMSLGSTVGTALPWVGAGLLAGKALGLFADGGHVNGREMYAGGGEVDGPGGPTDDMIPAWLSDGEYVLNADAVRHFGLDRLEKMNEVGLQMRGIQE